MLNIRSKFVAVFAAAVGVMLLIACYAVQTKSAAAADAAASGMVTVRDMAGLQTALKTARGGDTILLAPGSYSTLAFGRANFQGGQLTIASADPADRAVVAGIEIAESSGLTFRDLEVSLNARTQTVFNVMSSQDIRLEKLDLHAGPQGDKNGLLFRFSTNVGVSDSTFHDMGTAVRNVDSTFVTIAGNRFRQIRGDGVQTTGSSNVTIASNHFTDFHVAPGDHPDAIQFFTANQKASAHDITIVDNVIVRGPGDIIQGIFMGNEAGMVYVNVKISGNKIIGAMYNGIAIGGAQNVVISDNIVQAYRDMDSWIRVEGTTNATVANNQTVSMNYGQNTGLTQKDNKKLRAVKVGDVSALEGAPSDK